jgi:hypothetical protein
MKNLFEDKRPWFLSCLTLLITAVALHVRGRSWWCACGRPWLWISSSWSPETSQHLLDPYSFTHVLHGVLLCGVLALVVPRIAPAWRLWLAVVAESSWEILENSEAVIHRYRVTTAAYGYAGDSVGNSMGDILTCVLGFLLALRLGFRRSLLLFVAVDTVLLITIKDSLVLNIVMLIYPIDALRAWQGGH